MASFRDALAEERRRLIAEHADDGQLRLAVKLIDLWAEHPDTERVWVTITKKLPADVLPTASDFIRLVLNRRMVAKDINRVNKESSEVEAALRARANHLRESEDYSLAKTIKLRVSEFRHERARVLGHKPKSAAKTRFMTGWSDKFTALCGRPLYEVVAFLTGVAFDDVVGVDQVRDAHRRTKTPQHRNTSGMSL